MALILTKIEMENLPIDLKDVMITYERTVYYGPYSMLSKKETITKRGFYSAAFGNFTIPEEYKRFNGVLLPSGFNGDIIEVSKVINWEYCTES